LEHLLPEPDNTTILDLLFDFCTFHGLAKLRLQTDTTLQDLEKSVTRLGESLRLFKQTTCDVYHTTELPSEEAARGRRRAALSRKGNAADTQQGSRKKKKEFNLETYKLHSLGDYAHSIRMFGTVDNTSTQLVYLVCNII
jgi:hypothetical protein